jgi:uncharacterized membrane protein
MEREGNPKSVKETRKFFELVLEEWISIEGAASAAGHYTPEQQSALVDLRRKLDEAGRIYQIALLESMNVESERLSKLTAVLIVLTIILAVLALPSFIAWLSTVIK